MKSSARLRCRRGGQLVVSPSQPQWAMLFDFGCSRRNFFNRLMLYFRPGRISMPVYSFRVLPDDGADMVKLSFSDDDTALAQARQTLGDLAAEAAMKGRPIPAAIEVAGDD